MICQLDLQNKMHGKLINSLVSEGAVTYNELDITNSLSNVQLASPGFLKRHISAPWPYGGLRFGLKQKGALWPLPKHCH